MPVVLKCAVAFYCDDVYSVDGDDAMNDGGDVIFGGDGNDLIDGQSGDDFIFGDKDDDTLKGGKGNDFLDGGEGDDELNGGSGDDFLAGRAGEDELNGKLGDDLLFGDSNDDTLDGDWGDDLLFGQSGEDLLIGSLGDDTLNGGEGNDMLMGGFGEDEIWIDVCYDADTRTIDLLDDFDQIAQFSFDNLDRIIFRVTEDRVKNFTPENPDEWPDDLIFEKPFETAAERQAEVAEVLNNSLTVMDNGFDVEIRDGDGDGFNMVFFSRELFAPGFPYEEASDINSTGSGMTSNETYLALDIVYVEEFD